MPRARGSVIMGLALALTLTIFGVVIWAANNRGGPSISDRARLADMQQSAAAMQQAGQLMQTHGQTMLVEGQRAGDQNLTTHGNHWIADGQALTQGGQWMAMNPTVPASLVSDPGALQSQGSWGELTRAAQQMLSDPSNAKQVDLEALRWTGEAMQSEGRNMRDHGKTMAEEAELMVQLHGLTGQPADDLRQAARTMIQVGDQLDSNGQEMVAYAERLRQTLGFK